MAKRAPLQQRQQGKPAKPKKPAGRRAARSSTETAPAPFGPVVQAKTTVGPSHDRFEAEADRAADRVMSNSAGVPTISRLTTPPAQRKTTKAAKPQDEEKVQRKATKDGIPDEEKVQRKATKGAIPEDEEKVQRDAAGPTATAAPSGVESGIQSARGGGRPLSPDTRTRMESGFGRNFGGVRVHDDARAARLNNSINARAFTTGSDIFFGGGAYNENSSGGQRLLAHELTHVVQQDSPGRIQTKAIQRETDGNSPTKSDKEKAKEKEIDAPKPTIWPAKGIGKRGVNAKGPHDGLEYVLPLLEVPNLKKRLKEGNKIGTVSGGLGGVAGKFIPAAQFHWTTGKDGDGKQTSKQIQHWEKYISANGDLAAAITKEFGDDKDKYFRGTGGPRVYYLHHKNSKARIFTASGTAEELATNQAIVRPPFGQKGGRKQFMEVDHWIEKQLGGDDIIDNLWLLNKEANQKSGTEIRRRVLNDLKEIVAGARKAGFWGGTNPDDPGALRGWPHGAHITFAKVTEFDLGANDAGWDKEAIATGLQLKRLRHMKPHEMKDAGLNLDPGVAPGALSIFLNKGSPYRRVMTVDGAALKPRKGQKKKKFISGFDLDRAEFHAPTAEQMEDDSIVATLHGRAFGNRTVKGSDGKKQTLVGNIPDLAVPVRLHTKHGYESYIDRAYITQEVTKAALTGASPIAFEQVGLTDNWELLARGTVTGDNPLFSGFTFGITLQGDSVALDVSIPLESLSFGPFKPTEATLSLGVDKKGVFYAGTAAFELDGVGSGTLEADKQKLAGDFNFDIDAFDPASLGITYENGAWSGEGELGIKKGTIPFVQSALVNVRVDENGFFLQGTATLGGPGIPAGTTLEVMYDQGTGELLFGADVVFDTAGIKGLSSARVALKLVRSQDGAWSISGGGAAAISLPYVTGEAAAIYEDGYLDVAGKANISRPPMSGEAQFHLSNRPVDAEGQPIDGPPLPTFRVWGAGTASVTFGDYITGTVGVAFLENGEIELVGTVALPPSITLIEPAIYPYNILEFPQVRVPVIGLTIPVIRKSFGVFAFIGGGIDASVTVGPGELVDTEVTVNYNPDHPEEMSISGGSTFQMSAGAEVGLTVTGGIGAGLGIVEATGEVGLRGALGLDLVGGGLIAVNWTPADGLDIDATVFGEASPKFRLSVVAGAKIVVDAFLWSGTLWSRSWEHTLAEIGPDMTWRAELPASWSERDGLDLDINNLEITKPDINLIEFGTEIFDALTG